MKQRMWALAKRNIYSNRLVEIPYFLTSSFLMAALFVICSLMNNHYVRTRHSSLPILMGFALLTLFCFVFLTVIYGNRFIYQRRDKEFALYTILGLEKKHLTQIIRYEGMARFSGIFLLGILEGFCFGKLFFLSFRSILRDNQISMGEFRLDRYALLFLALSCLFFFFTTYVINSRRLTFSAPMSMLQRQQAGEKEPKTRYGALLLGMLFTAVGYGIVFQIQDPLSAILVFFVAVFFVMVGTYLLFGSLSIFLLKRWTKNKHYYYQPKHFLFLSRMIYRMKQNARGLAGIAIIASGILITMSTTLAVYGKLEGSIAKSMPMEFQLERSWNNNLSPTEKNKIEDEEEMMTYLNRALLPGQRIGEKKYSLTYTSFATLTGNELHPYSPSETPPNFSEVYYFNVEENPEKTKDLAPDELLVTTNKRTLPKTLTFMGKTYRVRKGKDWIASNIAVGAMYIVLPKQVPLEEAARFYSNGKKGGYSSQMSWNVQGGDREYIQRLRKELPGKKYHVESKEEFKEKTYSLNGGFAILGILVSTVLFVIGMLLVYYKQISEAYEDRQSIEKMNKVGLSKTMVKQSIDAQLFWLFFTPIVVAIIHSLVASHMMVELIQLFGVTEYSFYFRCLCLIVALFVVIYFLFYLYTSKVYLRIVNRGREEEQWRQ